LCDGEYCLDEALLLPLADKLKHLTHQDTLIVLHMMGSHGPTYFKRYADKQRLFTPDCQRSDIQNCSHQSLVNTYDNTIAYSDFVLSEIILQLDALAVVENVQTTMLYVSDHGESLGEKGLYLHGMPYALAPTEQTHVPLLLWQNDAQASSNVECLQAVSSEPISHDNLFDMLLGITSVRSTTYQADSDILAKCRTSDSRLAKVKTSSSDIEINN
jgi:lipid A ethanolaminephosphotransferase